MQLFRDRYPLLTNMADITMCVNGKTFTCLEAAFQSFKAVIVERDDLVDTFVGVSGKVAKRMGKKVPMTQEQVALWNEVRLDVMWQLLLIKVQHPAVRKQLLDAPDDDLFENNVWGDTFWGCVEQSDGTMVGENYLGRLLVEVKKVISSQPVTPSLTEIECPL